MINRYAQVYDVQRNLSSHWQTAAIFYLKRNSGFFASAIIHRQHTQTRTRTRQSDVFQ